MKNKYYFRMNINGDFDVQKPIFINFEFLSFHWENHIRWFTVFGISFIWEKGLFEMVGKNE